MKKNIFIILGLRSTLMEMSKDVIVCIENGWTFFSQRSSGVDVGFKIIGEKGMVEVDLTNNDVVLIIV